MEVGKEKVEDCMMGKVGGWPVLLYLTRALV